MLFPNTGSNERPLQQARISVRVNDENSKIQEPIIISFRQACRQTTAENRIQLLYSCRTKYDFINQQNIYFFK